MRFKILVLIILLSSSLFAQSTYNDLYKQAGSALKKLNYQKAIELLDQALAQKADFAKAFHLRGRAYYSLRQYQKALSDFDRAIELDPQFVEAFLNRGSAYFNLGKFDLMLSDYNRALEIDPNNGDAYYRRGHGYINAFADTAKALADYSHAIELDPELTYAFFNRGNIYATQNQDQKALADFEKAILLKPNLTQAYFNRTTINFKLKDFEPVVTDMKAVLAEDTTSCLAHYYLGVAYINLKEYMQAIAAYESCLLCCQTQPAIIEDARAKLKQLAKFK